MVASDPYALNNLLPAGTVQLHFDNESPEILADRSDNWCSLSPFLDLHRLHLTTNGSFRFKEIDFLVTHLFLKASWKISMGSILHVRVYLIPFDLPGVGGRLAKRNRDENKVLLPARKAMSSLLTYINRSTMAWAGNGEPVDDFEPFWPRQPNVTLSEIYGDLPSPMVDPSTFLSGIDAKLRSRFERALYWDSPPGMRPLYPYQRRTIARMLQQELDPSVTQDPLYITIDGVRGSDKTFYLQPSSMEILSKPPLCHQAKGGILCEEMGTGKTCIILGLIMTTKDHLSSPEESPLDVPPILTPIALRRFPAIQFERARRAVRMKKQNVSPPSLVDVLIHFIRASPNLTDPAVYDYFSSTPHLSNALKQNHPFYYVFDRIPETASPRRKGLERGPRKIYLTSATLVLVPRSIIGQWNSEINKHCWDGTLRVLLIDTGKKAKPMPSALELASDYDLLILTHERFAMESVRCNPSSLYSWEHCECSIANTSRKADCVCSKEEAVSPLIQIRWKRLIVDEGHVSAAANNLSWLCQELSVECRWIVSGTPTRNLMGLSLGLSTHASDSNESLSHQNEDDLPVTEDEGLTPEEDLLHPCENDLPRPWTRQDRNDLSRLGEMISKFIGVPRFAYDPNVFRKKVAAPLLNPRGPCFGSIQVVNQVMSQVMFRHQIQDVEREIPEKLPPLKEKTVVLKFQPLAAKTYNVLQAGIAINAVDSERQHQDYLFHSGQKARAALRQTLENLTQTMFWRTDPDIFDIDEALVRSEEALDRALQKKLPESDINLVKESIRVQRDASKDQLWRTIMKHEDNPFVVHGLSSALQDAWLKVDVDLLEDTAALMDPARLCSLRDVLLRSPLVSENHLIEHGYQVATEEERAAAAFEKMQQRSNKKRRHDEATQENWKVKKLNINAGSKEMQQELNRELSAAITRMEQGEENIHGPRISDPTAHIIGRLPPVSVGKSASSKVNYILRKVLKHSPKHKFLIFSASPLSLAYVAEALTVTRVPYLTYFSGQSATRQNTVVTFETSEKYRVLLMELKLGSRGLNLITASRIIFCEPVWHGDVESQAIKRAHRIGQKCSVLKVVTLVMQGTSEEAMVTRRHVLRRQAQRLPAMEEDVSMSAFLQNPTFIPPENVEPADMESLDIPLIDGYAAVTPSAEMSIPIANLKVDLQHRTSATNIAPLGSQAEPSLKRRKMVHFSSS